MRVGLVALALVAVSGFAVRTWWIHDSIAFVSETTHLRLPCEYLGTDVYDPGDGLLVLRCKLGDEGRRQLRSDPRFKTARMRPNSSDIPQEIQFYAAIEGAPKPPSMNGSVLRYHGCDVERGRSWYLVIDVTDAILWGAVHYPDPGGDPGPCFAD